MNQLVVRTSFPSILMEYKHDWADRMETDRPLVFDRVVVADRAAAVNGQSWQRTRRTASEAFALPGSAHWWSTIRNSVIGLSGLETPRGGNSNPVITYISRQDWGRRMLIPEDHDNLVQELYVLRDSYGYEVNIVNMEDLSRMEQLHLAGRTTVRMNLSLILRCLKVLIWTDTDGCPWKWSHLARLDEANRPFYGHGILLPRRFCTGLRMDRPRVRNGALWLLGQPVRSPNA